ncbi:MAG: hypothetical protein HY319_30055 [Armatimonadetes bacterium]|nr:hypothetical protein [Armatimonadota bacterium]
MRVSDRPAPRLHPASRPRPAGDEELISWWYDHLPRAARNVPYLEHQGRAYTAREVKAEVARGTELGKVFRERFLRHYRERAPHAYRVRFQGRTIESPVPGIYGGWRKGGIYGRLDCGSGKRILPENRVFFLTLEDAVQEGYRACKCCHPEKGPFRQE